MLKGLWDSSLSRSWPALTIPQLVHAPHHTRGTSHVEPPTPPNSHFSGYVNSQAEIPCLYCTCCFQPGVLFPFYSFDSYCPSRPNSSVTPSMKPSLMSPWRTYNLTRCFSFLPHSISPSSLWAPRKLVSDTEQWSMSISTSLPHNCEKHG